MKRRLLIAGGVFVGLIVVAVAAGGAYAYYWNDVNADRIARGVRIAGVDVGGLKAADARARVQAALGARLSKPAHLVYRDHRFTIRPTGAGLRVDVAQMVDEAVRLSQRGGLVHRLLRDVRGHELRASVALQAGLSESRVADVAKRVARVLDQPAHDAQLTPWSLATGVHVVPSRTGLAVKQPLLEQRLTKVLLRLRGGRTIAVPTRPAQPRVSTTALLHQYETLILISRETFTLRLYKQLRLVKTYPIAVGRAGLETPAGMYEINDKQVNPSWHVPNSSWAGPLAGRVIPPGPDDPIKARWLGFYNGAGIHGTADTWSLGSAASHGCVRMSIPDVEQLYDLVPLHTPVYVG